MKIQIQIQIQPHVNESCSGDSYYDDFWLCNKSHRYNDHVGWFSYIYSHICG